MTLGEGGPPLDRKQVDRIIGEYVAYLRSWQASDYTIRARKTLARSRLKAWGVEGFTARNIEAWLPFKANGEDRSKWTMATYHNHLTDLCEFLVATGRLPKSPMHDVRKVKQPKKLPRPLSDREVAKVLSVVEGDVRDWILLALFAGLRAFEIAKVRGEDVTEGLLFVHGKGGSEASLPLHPELAEVAERHPSRGYWFPGNDHGHIAAQQVSLKVGRLFEALGIDGSIHRVRHTYGTRLVRAGVHVRRVQQLMRHASLETTAGYTAVSEDELRDAVNLLPGSTPPAA